jgi:uroporphyrinogen decarboxylase
LGQKVTFTEGEGPSLSPVTSAKGFTEDRARWEVYFEPIYEALRLTRAGLPAGTALLGFAGGPWTLATYLAAGAGGDDQKAAKLWAYRDSQGFGYLLDILADCVAFHLIRQLDAGADAVQIFDSWASGLPAQLFEQVVIEPTRKIVTAVRAARPGAKIIGFPRAATQSSYETYVRATGVDALSLDTAMPIRWAADRLGCAFQGNLDPIVLIAGGAALDRAIDEILEATAGKPHIFNLGHGILPETPITHVEQLLKRVRV